MKIIQLLIATLFIVTLSLASDKEDALKGIILNRVSQFISYRETEEAFVICVYDNKRMYKTLYSLYENKEYKKRKIRIIHTKAKVLLPSCDVLYVSNPSKELSKKLTKSLQQYTLLVSDSIDSLDDGFMLALYLKDNKVNIAINQQALLDADLKVNYRLLKVASKVINPVKN